MKVAVGSTNPVKVDAVHRMVARIWPEADVSPIAVSSGVGVMPQNDEETMAGARNRANAARQKANADLGVGLEGGVHPEPLGLVLQGWVVIVDGNGREGVGSTARLPLPPIIARRVLAGEELGPVMDDLLNEHNVKQKGGAVGALTAGLVPRGDTFAIAVAYALAPFVSPEFYGDANE
jgi:inosine/xanthosine triphosphatase